MSGEQQAQEIPLADEGSWAYLIAPAEGSKSADRLRAGVVDACEASGWPTVTRSLSGARHGPDPGDFFEDLRHAVEHADVVVALLGDAESSLDAELAMAYGHRRPIVGIRLASDDPSSSELQAMLERYERAHVIACDNVDECASGLHDLFSDSGFALTVRAAGGERVAHA